MFGACLVALVVAIVLLLPSLLLPSLAEAAPFSAKRVPAQAEGLIHVDLDKLQSSKLWSVVKGHLPKEVRTGNSSKVSEDLIKAWDTLGEDGIETLVLSMLGRARSLTVWSGPNDDFALMLDMPLASTVLSTALKAGVPLKKTTQSGVDVYELDSASLAIQNSTIIVSTSRAPVVITANLLRGKGKSLSNDKLKKLGTARTKGIILVAGFGGKLMETFKKQAASAALKTDIQSILLFAGENNGTFFAEAEANVGSPATATKLGAIATGLLAVVALSSDEPELQKLASALRISNSGSSLTARLELPIKALLDLSKNL
jgi:hypothetical protein